MARTPEQPLVIGRWVYTFGFVVCGLALIYAILVDIGPFLADYFSCSPSSVPEPRGIMCHSTADPVRYFLQAVPLIETHLLVTALLVAGSVMMAGLGWYFGWTLERRARRALEGKHGQGQIAWSHEDAVLMVAIIGPVLQLTPLIVLNIAAYVVFASRLMAG
jgi:hypothetical protein